MISTIFYVPIAAKDVVRAGYTVGSIRKYCADYRIYLLVDGFDPATLPPGLLGPDVRVRTSLEASKGNWGLIWHTLILGMIAAHKEPDVAPDAIFVKIDSDALIIRQGFGDRIRRIFATRPAAGQVGQNFSSVAGARFSNQGWANYMRKMMGVRGAWHFARGALRRGESMATGLRAFAEFRAMLQRAAAHGYVSGDLCMGGCFALRREVVARMEGTPIAAAPLLRFLPALFDDVLMTPYVYSLGFAAIDDAADDGAFAIEGKQLRVDPFVLRGRGHYVIHPLKYGHKAHGHDLSEEELVAALLKA